MSGPNSELFQILIVQLAQGAWVALGKVPNPISGKFERNLEAARLTIDMLDALESRTKGNLSEDEAKILDRSLRDLRLNYVDEKKKDAASGDAVAAAAGESESRETEASESKTAAPESADGTPPTPSSQA